MSSFHIKYEDAYDAALTLAREVKLDTYIKGAKEYNQDGFRVGLMSRADSEFVLAERVTPTSPRRETEAEAAARKAIGTSSAK